MDQNQRTPGSEIEVTNAQLRMTLLAIRAVLNNRGVVLTRAALGKRDLLVKSVPENFKPALNSFEYASLFAHIRTNPQLRYNSDGDPTGTATLQALGRAYFRQMLNQHTRMAGISKTLLTLWGEEKRVRFVLEALVSLHKKLFLKSEPALLEKDGVFILNDYYCPYCEGQRAAEEPVCGFITGLLQEAILWATGVEYNIEETNCRARGDHSCQFSIARFPSKASSN